MHAALVGLALLSLTLLAAPCPYSDVKASVILAADATCAGGRTDVCGVSSSCVVLDGDLDNGLSTFTGFNSLGNVSNYVHRHLTMGASASMTFAAASLPSYLTSISFENVGVVNLSSSQSPWSRRVTHLSIVNGSMDATTFPWPCNLTSLTLRKNALIDAPSNLPSTLTTLVVEDNQLHDLPPTPPRLEHLHLDANNLTTITDLDWSRLVTVRLGRNPIETMARVQFSPSLRFFACDDCPLQQLTLTPTSFHALDALPPWDGNTSRLTGFNMTRNISSNRSACAKLQGTVVPLWAGKAPPLSFDVCLVRDTNGTAPTSLASIRAGTGLAIGGIASAFAIVLLVVVLDLKRRQCQGEAAFDDAYANVQPSPNRHAQTVYVYPRSSLGQSMVSWFPGAATDDVFVNDYGAWHLVDRDDDGSIAVAIAVEPTSQALVASI
ncbi:hypothetical protein SPRG_09305 [Saprolegnia parasitica CBS 223.65]|uniref:Leucine-rich repeat-containing N-terminal plant-type domain-containing protein n=1 Tax=Saprolegnia parasitica (strain CBS 223.65) TaxID=695850 RepID=A0A067CF47_SAPPC|nr:hypothetical protein SPRG_09305 [Saprolegnia parasitica CBS 223.65]KDO25156.1 hypothetical protein SPRG_09305 [Saprolegnia parasitica CBS 223.65]|eukprot:XP_012204224.1 hypothetical protein SPRG_09305 [Saprolegnia parasitica CBS 223.65]